MRTWDANEAVADVAYRLAEVIAIYPITPASAMGEHADAWAALDRPNVWGQVPQVLELQSEAGAAGCVHGALQGGALATTFTASQGLLLMLPNLYKIAGELTPFVLHVAARTLATHALSIFGDHSDVYAARQTGMALLCSASVQEAHDQALVAHAATLKTRIPFLHFFDGFRTSHEVARTAVLSDDDVLALVDDHDRRAHRARALTPDRPVLRGTAQNPDTFFQSREAAQGLYDACPDMVQALMEALARRTGRRYRLFDYVGHPEADKVVVMMGSGAETAHEVIEELAGRGERVGFVKVRLFRPFSVRHFLEALPPTVRRIAVLDRAKEPGSTGEPLYLDVVAALHEARHHGSKRLDAEVTGGRYGLSGKEFDPPMVRAVLDALSRDASPRSFTVGITDDVLHRSLPVDRSFEVRREHTLEAVFYGLGSDGTVGMAKGTAGILGEAVAPHVQGFFVYDSRKAGAITVSHLRAAKSPIRSAYLVRRAGYVAVHHPSFLHQVDVLERAAHGAKLVLNVPWRATEVWKRLPKELQEGIRERQIETWVIDASTVARNAGLGRHISTVMQAAFFCVSGVLPTTEALGAVKSAISETYAKKGEAVIFRNHKAVDEAQGALERLVVPVDAPPGRSRPSRVGPLEPQFARTVTGPMLEGRGDDLPVSALPVDGTWPVGTSRLEKRAIGAFVPEWDPNLCIQCNKCALVCPHAAIRVKVFDPAAAPAPPSGFAAVPFKGTSFRGHSYTVQVAVDDCTGCLLCSAVCPAKDKHNPRHKALDMVPVHFRAEVGRRSWPYFLALPDPDRTAVGHTVKDAQFHPPLFEFSGACSGCGETPYVKLLTQLFGDRLLIANATGCSSIYGGNLPTTPYCTDQHGRGPAWSNSLFEDNAEYGLGIRVAVDRLSERAGELLARERERLGPELVDAMLGADQGSERGIADQRVRVSEIRSRMDGELLGLVDYLVRKSVWIVGGDGWAYDIGFGGLDHVLASGHDVNVLVLDTEVYSNTGGQQSKATPLGAVAKFAASGKAVAKKDLGLLAMAYGNVYVAQVALGAKDAHTQKALLEAESWHGPSLVIAYSHCIAHGYDLSKGLEQQKRAVDSGAWLLYRHDPRRRHSGEPPLVLDSGPPTLPLQEYWSGEGRFAALLAANPDRAATLLQAASEHVRSRYARYEARAREVG